MKSVSIKLTLSEWDMHKLAHFTHCLTHGGGAKAVEDFTNETGSNPREALLMLESKLRWPDQWEWEKR